MAISIHGQHCHSYKAARQQNKSRTLSAKLRIFHHILDKLEENNLYLKPEKCEFEQEEIKYLGLIIRRNQLRMDPAKI
jgi:hypothetical protein